MLQQDHQLVSSYQPLEVAPHHSIRCTVARFTSAQRVSLKIVHSRDRRSTEPTDETVEPLIRIPIRVLSSVKLSFQPTWAVVITTEVLLDIAGPHAMARQTDFYECRTGESLGPDAFATTAHSYFIARAVSIFSGTNEVQRNIVAKAILGL